MKEPYEPIFISINVIDPVDNGIEMSSDHDNGYTDIEDLP